MKIAVLNYAIGYVEIINAPEMDSVEQVEKYLTEERGYYLDSISYMCDVNKIEIE